MQVRSLLQIAEAFGLVVFRVDFSAYVKVSGWSGKVDRQNDLKM